MDLRGKGNEVDAGVGAVAAFDVTGHGVGKTRSRRWVKPFFDIYSQKEESCLEPYC
jgi:hypothetical protein